MTNRVVGLAFGALYLAVGVLGLVTNPVLGLITTSLLGSALHLAVAVALLLPALLGLAKPANAILGTVLLVAGIFGLFTISTDANVLGTNGAANLLHFASAAALLLVGLGAENAGHTRPAKR